MNIGNKYSKYTPLMAAARNANFDLVKLLLKAGADPLAKELVSGMCDCALMVSELSMR